MSQMLLGTTHMGCHPLQFECKLEAIIENHSTSQSVPMHAHPFTLCQYESRVCICTWRLTAVVCLFQVSDPSCCDYDKRTPL